MILTDELERRIHETIDRYLNETHGSMGLAAKPEPRTLVQHTTERVDLAIVIHSFKVTADVAYFQYAPAADDRGTK